MARELIKGNEAIAEAAIRAGCRLFFGYPITPSTEIIESLAKKMPAVGGSVVQGEDEIASINMCYGAAATGARTMTASSGPGFSLKQEGLSYLAAAQLPVVIVNVNRTGPGLGGLGPTQGDYFQCTKGGGHGDYKNIVLAPSRGQEIYDLTMEAFDIADKYRNPVVILIDGFLGQMMEAIEFKDALPRPLPLKDYIVDGCKGRTKRKIASYSLTNEIGELNNIIWENKYRNIKNELQLWEEEGVEEAEIIIVAYGICGRIAKSVIQMAQSKGVKVGLIRPITLWPFPERAFNFKRDNLKAIVSLELSTGQMIEDVRLAIKDQVPVHLYRRLGGMLPHEDEVLNFIKTLACDKRTV